MILFHDWLLKYLNLFGVHENIYSLITQSKLYWRTTLIDMPWSDVEIFRGIFQVDSLSPLLFVISLMPLCYLLRKTNKLKAILFERFSYKIHPPILSDIKLYSTSKSEQDSFISTVAAFSGNICMSFGVNKCCVASLHQGRLVESSDIVLPCGNSICSLP